MGRGGRNTAPAPLTPADCALSGYPSILIDIPRLRQSDFDATPDDAAWRAGLNLWFSAWESKPAGSLRADDTSLSKAAGLGRDLKTWKRVKSIATQGFVQCSDGRLYHRTLCEVALGIWIDKLIRRHSGQQGNRGSITAAEKQTELLSISLQIGEAAQCLRVLNPSASALTKAARYAQSAPQCEPQCGPKSGALGPQYKGSEGNGSKRKSPSQDSAEVIQLGAGAASR